MIALLVMTDGRRDCIREAIPSALANLHGPIKRRLIHDDSADPEYRSWLASTFPTFEIIAPATRLGFGGAIRNAWSVLAQGPERFVWHHEDDFTVNRPVDLLDLMAVLDQNPHLLQLALRRQPWNDEERAAGGIVESHPDDYAEMVDHAHRHWLEHRRFFTTNPSLYRRTLCEGGWTAEQHSEGVMTHRWLNDPTVRFGFWGARDSGEWVRHVGHQRVGVGY